MDPFNDLLEGEDAEDGIGQLNTNVSTTNNNHSPTLITKPPGEAGRKNNGGYSLKEKLEWDDTLYTEVQVIPYHSLLQAPTDSRS
jgi:hypothetical protein